MSIVSFRKPISSGYLIIVPFRKPISPEYLIIVPFRKPISSGSPDPAALGRKKTTIQVLPK